MLVAATAAAALAATLLKQQPAFYDAACHEEVTDPAKAALLFTRFTDLQQDIRESKPDWGRGIDADELNAFLRENLERGASLDGTLNRRIRSPRVAIDGDRLTVAARYQAAPFEFLECDSTTVVVSVEMKIWVVSQRQNTVAVEITRLAAGAVPIGAQRYLDRLAEAARDANVEVTWYRNNGNPVGLFRFYADLSRPTTLIRTAKIADGRLTVGGKSYAEIPAP